MPAVRHSHAARGESREEVQSPCLSASGPLGAALPPDCCHALLTVETAAGGAALGTPLAAEDRPPWWVPSARNAAAGGEAAGGPRRGSHQVTGSRAAPRQPRLSKPAARSVGGAVGVLCRRGGSAPAVSRGAGLPGVVRTVFVAHAASYSDGWPGRMPRPGVVLDLSTQRRALCAGHEARTAGCASAQGHAAAQPKLYARARRAGASVDQAARNDADA